MAQTPSINLQQQDAVIDPPPPISAPAINLDDERIREGDNVPAIAGDDDLISEGEAAAERGPAGSAGPLSIGSSRRSKHSLTVRIVTIRNCGQALGRETQRAQHGAATVGKRKHLAFRQNAESARARGSVAGICQKRESHDESKIGRGAATTAKRAMVDRGRSLNVGSSKAGFCFSKPRHPRCHDAEPLFLDRRN
jgi:hypothetical protein